MKKILKMIMSFVMMMSLVGCQTEKEPDPKEVFVAATEKTAALEYRDYESNMTISLMGMEIEMPVSGRTIMKDGKPVAMEVEVDSMGEVVNTIYTDGYIYMDMMGIKIKCASTIDEFLEMNGESEAYYVDSELIDTVTLGEVDEDGNQTYIVTFTEEGVKEISKPAAESAVGEDGEYEITEISYTGTVNDEGYLSKIEITMKMKIKAQGVSMESDLVVEFNNKNIGETFEITPPEDSAVYEEYSLEDILGA